MIPIKDRRIVLLGGAGFIGHSLALTLKSMGAEVTVVDSLQVNNLVALMSDSNNVPHRNLYISMIQQRLDALREAKIPIYTNDVRDYLNLSHLLNKLNPQAIVHLAAVAHADRSNKDPYSTFDHSLRTLENALDCARNSVEHFVYFSSSMVYGNFKNGLVTEDDQCEPLGIYGALKLAGEKIVIAYNQVFNLPYTIVRPSALYGPRCISRRVGQVLIENAISGTEISISGDGSDRLDFTYIQDVVNGVVKVLENENSHGQTFNLTYGSSRSIAEMVEVLRKNFPDIAIKNLPRDKLMPARGTLSVDKARKLLGYEPTFPLERGFVEYINWYRNAFRHIVK